MRVLNLSKLGATQCEAIKTGLISDVFIANNIINGYIRSSELVNAHNLFTEMPHRDSASWNTMVAGYVNSGDFSSAWEFFNSMKRSGFGFDGYSFGSILKGIACNGFLFVGKQVHSHVIKCGYGENVYSCSALLDMYAKCSMVEEARKVFRYMPARNSVSWNALIAGYVEIRDLDSCFQLLNQMECYEGVHFDDGTFSPLLTLFDDPKFYRLLSHVHAKVLKLCLDFHNTVLNAMITSYSECGSLDNARRVFDNAVGYRDLVSWNSMLGACLQHGQLELAFLLFREMEQFGVGQDIYTYTSIISACNGAQGKPLHALVVKRGLEKLTSVSNSLVSMYLKSNRLGIEDAVKVFENIEIKDSVSWNSILTGLSQTGQSEDALKMFIQMLSDCLEIDHYAFSAALRSCSDLATLQLGKQLHGLVMKSGFETNEYITSALIFMYFKCGILEDARKTFQSSAENNSTIAWNSIMFAYAHHGQAEVALELFLLMVEKKIKLDHITFVAVLTACSHNGLVEEGQRFLNSMESHYGISPRMEHYACAIDLLGRAGRLNEAKEVIKEMPFEPDVMVWKTLLGACRACGDIEMAKEVASHLLELEPKEHCTYVLLSDMYGYFSQWDEIASVKRLMRDRGVRKIPGWSWIEVAHNIHGFNARDHSHPCCQEVYRMLDELTSVIKMSDIILVSPDFCLDFFLDDAGTSLF